MKRLIKLSIKGKLSKSDKKWLVAAEKLLDKYYRREQIREYSRQWELLFYGETSIAPMEERIIENLKTKNAL